MPYLRNIQAHSRDRGSMKSAQLKVRMDREEKDGLKAQAKAAGFDEVSSYIKWLIRRDAIRIARVH